MDTISVPTRIIRATPLIRIPPGFPAVSEFYRTLTAARPLAGTRQLGDGPLREELQMESEWADALSPMLNGLYMQSVRPNLERVLDDGEEAISRSILDYFREHPELVVFLALLLRQFGRRAFNLGGQIGLNMLGLTARFELTDEELIAAVNAQADELTDPDSELSLLKTTANDLGRVIHQQHEEGITLSDMPPFLSAWALGRTIIRSAIIAETESVRFSRWGMAAAFVGNGARSVIRHCEPDVIDRCTTGTCIPWCGEEFTLSRSVFDPFSSIPSAATLPLHPRCRCWDEPQLGSWVAPALIWTGFAIGLLGD